MSSRSPRSPRVPEATYSSPKITTKSVSLATPSKKDNSNDEDQSPRAHKKEKKPLKRHEKDDSSSSEGVDEQELIRRQKERYDRVVVASGLNAALKQILKDIIVSEPDDCFEFAAKRLREMSKEQKRK